MIRHAHGIDVLVHECTESGTWAKERASHQIDTSHIKHSHTQPDQLGLVARDAAAKKLVATHMNPKSVPDELKSIIARDYDGPITIGADLMTV